MRTSADGGGGSGPGRRHRQGTPQPAPARGPSHGRAPRLRPGVGVERPSGAPSILLATGRGRTLSPVSGGTGPGFSPSPRGPVIVGAVGGVGKYKKLCSGECRARMGAFIPCGHDHRSVISLVPVTTAESALPGGSVERVVPVGRVSVVGPGGALGSAAIPVETAYPAGSASSIESGCGRVRRRYGPPGRVLPFHPGRRAAPHRRLPARPAPRPGD